jgi:hypothetical protein
LHSKNIPLAESTVINIAWISLQAVLLHAVMVWMTGLGKYLPQLYVLRNMRLVTVDLLYSVQQN